MDSILQFYRNTRERFPTIVDKTDKEHLRRWDLGYEYAYSWFQSLANMLNAEMRKQVDSDVAGTIFDYMREQFVTGSTEVRNCIDVSFVENLFWQVPSETARLYWLRMPDLLKNLYVEFHASSPC